MSPFAVAGILLACVGVVAYCAVYYGLRAEDAEHDLTKVFDEEVEDA